MNSFSGPFAVVLPMHNEETLANHVTEDVHAILGRNQWPGHIIVVDDGSSDKTFAALKSMQIPLGIHVLRHARRNGYGAACWTGIQAALALDVTYAIVMDGDGTQDPNDLRKFFPLMIRGIHLIKATRYRLGGRALGVPWWRRAVSWGGNLLARAVLRAQISDYTNGFRALHRDLASALQPKTRGFETLIEEVRLAKQMGFSIGEVPYVLRSRKKGHSISKFSYGLPTYRKYLRQLFP